MIGDLDLPYFKRSKIRKIKDGIKISFSLPTFSMFELVEFVKLNNLYIDFRYQNIEITYSNTTLDFTKRTRKWWK